jgi:hypothetical protein
MLGRGIAQDLLGQHPQAQASYRTVLAADPQNMPALNNLALSMVLAGDPNGAVSVLQPLATRSDAPPRVRNNLSVAQAAAGGQGLAPIAAAGPTRSQDDTPLPRIAAAPTATRRRWRPLRTGTRRRRRWPSRPARGEKGPSATTSWPWSPSPIARADRRSSRRQRPRPIGRCPPPASSGGARRCPGGSGRGAGPSNPAASWSVGGAADREHSASSPGAGVFPRGPLTRHGPLSICPPPPAGGACSARAAAT